MKALCAVLCLGLLSVCRAAPLTCDQFTQDAELNFSGKWYVHAMSTDLCALTSTFGTFVKQRIILNVVNKETPNSYEVITETKVLSYCHNQTQSIVFDKTSPTSQNQSESHHLLRSSCSDCTVLKIDGSFKALFLCSRNTTIDAVDLMEFERQAACLGLLQPVHFSHDDDMSYCKDPWARPTDEETTIFTQIRENYLPELLKCAIQYFISQRESS